MIGERMFTPPVLGEDVPSLSARNRSSTAPEAMSRVKFWPAKVNDTVPRSSTPLPLAIVTATMSPSSNAPESNSRTVKSASEGTVTSMNPPVLIGEVKLNAAALVNAPTWNRWRLSSCASRIATCASIENDAKSSVPATTASSASSRSWSKARSPRCWVQMSAMARLVWAAAITLPCRCRCTVERRLFCSRLMIAGVKNELRNVRSISGSTVPGAGSSSIRVPSWLKDVGPPDTTSPIRWTLVICPPAPSTPPGARRSSWRIDPRPRPAALNTVASRPVATETYWLSPPPSEWPVIW